MAGRRLTVVDGARSGAVIEVTRRTKTYSYELADAKDWALLFDNMVLEVKARGGVATYWPLDSVTMWTVREMKKNRA